MDEIQIYLEEQPQRWDAVDALLLEKFLSHTVKRTDAARPLLGLPFFIEELSC